LNAKDIVLGARDFGIVSHIRLSIDDVDVVKVPLDALAKPIKGFRVDERAIGNEGDDTLLAQAIGRPAKEAGLHIVDNDLVLGGTFFDVAVFDGFVDAFVGAVSVALVEVFLVSVVGRVADNDGDGAIVLLLNAGRVLHTHGKQVKLMACRTAMIERIHQADILKLLVVPHPSFADR